jgi:leucyl/phenylalanyl-tRNA--protein transferase
MGTLHRLGHAHSIEAWEGDQLVGGLFGVCVGQMFYGCSMFHRRPNASKVTLVHLVKRLGEWRFLVIDCAIYNPYLKQ